MRRPLCGRRRIETWADYRRQPDDEEPVCDGTPLGAWLNGEGAGEADRKIRAVPSIRRV